MMLLRAACTTKGVDRVRIILQKQDPFLHEKLENEIKFY